MVYIDAFVGSVPKDKIEVYKDLVQRSAPVWQDLGAIGYVECLGDDVPYGELTSFPRGVMAKDDEAVTLSWIVYPSREARDAGNSKMMSDPRMKELMETMPVDGDRMFFGGFVPAVQGGDMEEPFGYVDGFIVAVSPDRLDEYKKMARLGQTVWSEHGAIAYAECMADDVPCGELTSFPRAVEAKPDDIVFFSFATYKDRAARDTVNSKVMADPRLQGSMENSPFDAKRMIYGGFNTILRQ